MFDKLQEECGVFGIYNSKEASINTALGLHALQHRGQEAAGIISLQESSSQDHPEIFVHFADGLVSDNFTSNEVIKKLSGTVNSILPAVGFANKINQPKIGVL